MDEVKLPGGNVGGAVHVGDTVRRPAGRWTPTIQRLLGTLADAGIPEVPRPLGLDDHGREVVSYIPGDTVADEDRWPRRCVHRPRCRWPGRCGALTGSTRAGCPYPVEPQPQLRAVGLPRSRRGVAGEERDGRPGRALSCWKFQCVGGHDSLHGGGVGHRPHRPLPMSGAPDRRDPQTGRPKAPIATGDVRCCHDRTAASPDRP